MTLRTKLALYLIAIHLPAAVVAGFVFQENRLWLIAFEIYAAISLAVGSYLLRATFRPLEILESGRDLIAEEEFATRFRKVGNREFDDLADLYNAMLERLRVERLRAEEQTSLVTKLVDVTPAGIVMLDFDGLIDQVNPAARRLLRVDDGAIRGFAIEALGEEISSAVADLKPGESHMVALDGRRRLRVWRGEFYDRGFQRSFVLIEELTEELRSSERSAYEKVIRMLSHEINNSVAAVSSLLESLLSFSSAVDTSKREDYVSAIEISRNRLRNLDAFTRDFASVVRIPAPATAEVDLLLLVRDVFRLYGPELANRKIEWRVDAPETAVITADQNQMEQVLINVLQNAIDAIGTDGLIDGRIAAENGRVTVAIGDTGTGISEEIRPNLFTPFFSSKRNGRGLGLTLVHEILSNHGADFSLRPRPDRGAEFVMTFKR